MLSLYFVYSFLVNSTMRLFRWDPFLFVYIFLFLTFSTLLKAHPYGVIAWPSSVRYCGPRGQQSTYPSLPSPMVMVWSRKYYLSPADLRLGTPAPPLLSSSLHQKKKKKNLRPLYIPKSVIVYFPEIRHWNSIFSPTIYLSIQLKFLSNHRYLISSRTHYF